MNCYHAEVINLSLKDKKMITINEQVRDFA